MIDVILECVRQTGIEIVDDGHVIFWQGEFGGELEFLCVDWVTYKFTRPNIKSKGVVGMWGLSLDPIPVMGPTKHTCRRLRDADVNDYDAVVILGCHSSQLHCCGDPYFRPLFFVLKEREGLIFKILHG
jgi:hypothetical protein